MSFRGPQGTCLLDLISSALITIKEGKKRKEKRIVAVQVRSGFKSLNNFEKLYFRERGLLFNIVFVAMQCLVTIAFLQI